jgi:hypothetical protein
LKIWSQEIDMHAKIIALPLLLLASHSPTIASPTNARSSLGWPGNSYLQDYRPGYERGCPADVSEADRYRYPACNATAAPSQQGGCPADVSEADRYRYPACNGAAATPRQGGGPSGAARHACEAKADGYLNMPPGTSEAGAAQPIGGGSYRITLHAGRYKAVCTVSGSGDVTSMDPAY